MKMYVVSFSHQIHFLVAINVASFKTFLHSLYQDRLRGLVSECWISFSRLCKLLLPFTRNAVCFPSVIKRTSNLCFPILLDIKEFTSYHRSKGVHL